MNRGAPISDVITPMGSSLGDIIVLEISSQSNKKILPKNIEVGSMTL